MPTESAFVILTGGTSKRMGQDKAGLMFGADSLLAFQYQQIPAESPVVIVGPQADFPATYLTENPAGGGPAAGLAAAMNHITSDSFAVIAVDSPFGLPWLSQQTLEHGIQAVIPRDSEQRPHYLCALYNTVAFKQAIASLGNVAHASMRDLISHFTQIQYVDSPATELLTTAEVLLDINTPADLVKAHSIRNRIWSQ